MDGHSRVRLATCSRQELLIYAQGTGSTAIRARGDLLGEYEGFLFSIIKDIHPFRKGDEGAWREERREARQSAYASFLEALGRFDPSRGVDLTTFSYWRVRGAVVDALYEYTGRQRVRDARDSDSSAVILVPLEEVVEVEVDPATDLEEVEEGLTEATVGAVRAFVQCLPAEQRYMVEQVYVKERTQAEVAEELGKSPAAVSKALAKFRLQARAALDSYMPDLAA